MDRVIKNAVFFNKSAQYFSIDSAYLACNDCN